MSALNTLSQSVIILDDPGLLFDQEARQGPSAVENSVTIGSLKDASPEYRDTCMILPYVGKFVDQPSGVRHIRREVRFEIFHVEIDVPVRRYGGAIRLKRGVSARVDALRYSGLRPRLRNELAVTLLGSISASHRKQGCR